MIRILSLATLCLAGSLAVAQAPHGGKFLEMRAPPIEQQMERLTLLLELDEYQKGQVQRILEEQRQHREELMAGKQASQEMPDLEEMQAEHERMRQETLTKLEAILSVEQLEKYQALMPQHEVHIKRRGY